MWASMTSHWIEWPLEISRWYDMSSYSLGSAKGMFYRLINSEKNGGGKVIIAEVRRRVGC
jgi:hypothetical protein